MNKLQWLGCLLAFSTACWADYQPQVRVVGLFSNAALLSLDGQRMLVKAGQTGPGGVRVLEADSRSALLEIQGRQQRVGLEREYSLGGYSEPELQTLVIQQSQDSHYWASGTINGQSMRFLLDTGASSVALNASHAKRLGLPYLEGRELEVTTASGTETGWVVTLNSVKLGGLEVRDVEAVVLEGDHPLDALLGMSFLKQINWRQEQDSLVLESRF